MSGMAVEPSRDTARLSWACTQALMREHGWQASAAALVSELANQLGCERVSLGWREGLRVQVVALSHGAQVATHPALDELAGAMYEAISQSVTLNHAYNAQGSAHLTLAHQALLRRQGVAAVMTVPVAEEGEVIAALSFERSTTPFLAAEVLLLEQVAAAVAPLLVMKRQLDLPWRKRAAARLRTLRQRLSQPDYVWMRWAAGSAALTLVAGLLVPVPHRVSANSRLEGAVQRVMTAPQDGFLRQVHVRPGDSVKAGQVMAVLSDDDLQYSKRSRQAEVSQHDNAFADAFARGDRAQAAIEQARAAEARAELALVDQQIARTQVTAPFDGVVIQGDLSHQLGAPLKRGETLVTLSPTADFRVILEVDERDIGLLELEQTARLLLSALPGQPIDLKVKRITPVARTIDGRLRYEVQADPVNPQAAAAMGLRPGLQGVAKVDLPWTPLAWRGLRYAWQQICWASWVWL